MALLPFGSAPTKLQETIGTRLRSLSSIAEDSNPWSSNNPYMKAVAPWQPSTAYLAYSAVVNGGQVYICVAGGTSAASGGPNVANTAVSITDGSATWTWFQNNQVTSDPSLSQPAWAASTAYTAGNQVVNLGKVYAAVVGGTSTTGTGPTATTNAVTDGGVTWTYMGLYKASPYATNFPIVTSSGSAPGGLTNLFYFYRGIGITVNAANALNNGTGYVVGDQITLAGGTFTTAASVQVTAINVATGAVQGAKVINNGSYTLTGSSALTQGSTTGSGTGASFLAYYSSPPWCNLHGAHVAGLFSSYTYARTFNSTIGNIIGLQFSFEFYSDAPVIAFSFEGTNNVGTNFIIDGVRYAQESVGIGASNLYYSFDFSASSGRKKRLYRVEATGPIFLPQVLVDPNSQCWRPDTSDQVTCVCISDSLFAGSGQGPFLVGNTTALRVGHAMGWKDMWAFVQGGTGWVNRGTTPGVGSDNFGFRIPEALTLNPDVFLFMGSTNDNGLSSASITAAVVSGLQAIRAGGSSAVIIVAGVWSINNSNISATEAAVQAGVVAAADPLRKTIFFPIYNDPMLPWITGTWNNNPTPSGLNYSTSTNATQYIGADNLHPTDNGTEMLGGFRLPNAIRTNVIGIIT